MGLALDEPTEADEQISVDQLNFVIEKRLAKNFPQITVDYSDSWFAKGFSIRTGSAASC